MIRTCTIALAALLPVLASAQFSKIGVAKEAAKNVEKTNAERAKAADAAAPAETSQPAGQGLQLERAPARLEGSASAAPGQGAVPPPDTYTIRPGDTLWDLSGRFLNNPWYWPKVWSFNPDITNPHWIEPGNLLKFYPSAEEAPARVEPATPSLPAGIATGAEVVEETEVAEPKELEDFSRADLKNPSAVGEGDEVLVSGPYKIGFVPPRTVMARRDAFVTAREVEGSGTLVAAFQERSLLAQHDEAYARFRSAAGVVPGENYVIYKTERAVHHPITKELLGYQTTILGTARALKVDDKAVTVVISQSLEPIERGALLGPWTERLVRPVQQRPNAREVKARIVGSPVDVLTMLGEQHVVFLDKGKADGVEEGNVFRVVRSGDLLGLDATAFPSDPSLPTEVVGDLLVIDVKDTTSSALVTRSLRELAIGDRAEMRAAGVN